MALPKHTQQGTAEAPETDLQEAIRRAGDGERVVVSGEGGVIAVVIPPADLRRLQEDDRRRAAAIEALYAVGKAFEHLEPDEVEREAVKAVREVRAEMYAERMARGE